MTINVVKRDGSKQPLDLDKFHQVVAYAVDGINGVSASEVELKSQIQFYNNIKSDDVQETLIKAAANLISEENPNYQHVAGRLVNYQLRKQVYGQYEPIDLYTHVTNVVKKGFYDKDLLTMYSAAEYDQLNKMIRHDRDEHLTYVAMEQFRGKYLVKNRVTGQILETPQMAYILIAAVLFHTYAKDKRMYWIKRCYDAISQQEISLATPVLAGIRTNERQYSSCVLIEGGDSRDSINAMNNNIVNFISARAGLGLLSTLRAEGSGVQGGAKKHTGVRPFWRTHQSNVQSCSQGGLRPGAATMNWFFFHLEFEDLIVLKDPKQTEDNRLNRIDYVLQVNRLFYQRFLADEEITLFSPDEIPDVIDAFYKDTDRFIELYEAAERNPKLRKKKLRAKDMMEQFVEQRFATGRYYLMNVDHCNEHGSFIPEIAPIKMTNLCVEITLPTGEIVTYDPTVGEIALCILCALNVGVIRDHEHMMSLAETANRMLNNLIDYQDYIAPQSERATKKRRPIGVGIINLAYWMAKHNMTFTDANYEMLHELFESYAYANIYASTVVAEEQGPCPGYNETKYSQGILPIDTYKKDLDTMLGQFEYKQDWELLRDRCINIGMANSTVMAGMPSESSSQVANGTSGFDPIRSIVTSKQSGDGVLSQVVPEPRRLKNKYEILWNIVGAQPVLKVNALAQKFMDQSISTNTSYNPMHYENEEVPQDVMVMDILVAYKLGIKTLYYNNVLDGASDGSENLEVNEEQVELSQEDCEGCML